MNISQEKLNKLTFDSAKFLAGTFTSYISGIRKEDIKNYVDIYLDNPSQPAKPLFLSTENEEITVAFGETHDHISAYNNETEEELIEEMIIGIVKIITGVEKTYSAWDKGKWLGCGVLKSKPFTDDLKDSIFKDAKLFKVVAWNANDNEEIIVT